VALLVGRAPARHEILLGLASSPITLLDDEDDDVEDDELEELDDDDALELLDELLDELDDDDALELLDELLDELDELDELDDALLDETEDVTDESPLPPPPQADNSRISSTVPSFPSHRSDRIIPITSSTRVHPPDLVLYEMVARPLMDYNLRGCSGNDL